MGLRINTNVQSQFAQNRLETSTREQSNALEKLSSGQRINRASDDAAGLAISEKLKANIRGVKQAERNANDGISMIQVAEGGLNEVSNILVRLRELSIQAASDTVGKTERGFSDMEYQQLTKEIDRIANSTNFNGIDLLNGQAEEGVYDFQIGVNNDDFNDRISFAPEDVKATGDFLGVNGLDIKTKDKAQTNLTKLDSAITKISENRSNLGALQSRLQSTINNLQTKNENLSAANSRIRDTDMAKESSELVRANLLTNAGTTVLAQANTSQQAALRLLA